LNINFPSHLLGFEIAMTKTNKSVRQASGVLALSVLLVCALSQVCSGYSVLTHEEIVDLLWVDQM